MEDYVEKQQICFISVTLISWSGRKLLDPTTHIINTIPLALRHYDMFRPVTLTSHSLKRLITGSTSLSQVIWEGVG